MGHHLLAVLSCCVAATELTAQDDPVAALIERLAVPAQRDDASRELLRLGAATAAPLAARLVTATDDHTRACLAVLTELGPAGGDAVPALAELAASGASGPGFDHLPQTLATLTELILYREQDLAGHLEQRIATAFRRPSTRGRDDRIINSVSQQRFTARLAFPRHLPLDSLLALAQDRRPWVAEAAIEQLGRLGPAADGAVPVLRAVLQRPEPRILPTDLHVPLHRRTARALLAIDPDGSDAATARSVLAGTWSQATAARRTPPPRVMQRLDELLAELQAPAGARRAAAVDNLIALGRLAAEPVGALLTVAATDDALAAALEVLRRLGKDGAAAAPALATALTTLSTTHTVAVVKALTATLPGSEHTYVPPWWSSGVRRLVIQGQRIPGPVGADFLNSFDDAMDELLLTLTIPAASSPAELRALLVAPWLPKRQRALEVIANRGPACASLVDQVAPFLTARQPVWNRPRWSDDGQTVGVDVDRTDVIQRLAAAAILAIAPADHPLVVTARERLARPEAK